jgi:hypothetical protein
MRLVLAPKPIEKIDEKLLKSRDRKSGKKYLQKSQKWKILQNKIEYDLTRTHSYIDANRHNIFSLFGGLARSLTFSPLFSYTM